MKNEAKLLGSGSFYFVVLKEGEKLSRHILNQTQYNTFFEGLNNDAKFVKVGKNYHFWSKVDSFGEVDFEPGVLEKITSFDEELKKAVFDHIERGGNVSTMDNLRTVVSLYKSTRLD